MRKTSLPLWLAFGLIVVTLGLCPTTSPAEELQPGVAYPGGKKVEVSALGLSLTVPTGWTATLPPGSDILVLQHPNQQGYVMTTARQMSAQELKAWLSQPIDLGDGVVLAPKTPMTATKDGRFVGEYTVRGSPQPMEAYVVGKTGTHGISAAALGAYPPRAAKAVRQATDALMASMTLGKPAASAPVAKPGGGTSPWAAYLRGRKLVRLYTGSQYSEKDQVWLCSDGTFHRTSSGGGFGMSGASGAYRGVESGTWTATGSGNVGQVQLQYQNGSRSSHVVELRDNQLYVDGTRWFRTENDYCQ